MIEIPDSIEGIYFGDRLQYLGVIVNDKRSCFQVQKVEMIQNASRLANTTYNDCYS